MLNDVAVFGDTNLELPSFLSNRSAVEVHMDVSPNLLLRQKNGLDINIELPLHARYPVSDEDIMNCEKKKQELFFYPYFHKLDTHFVKVP